MTGPRLRCVPVMRPAELFDRLFDDDARAALSGVADLDRSRVLTELGTDQARQQLASAEVLLTGWGCPTLDRAALEAAPRLRAVVHAGGLASSLFAPDALVEADRRGILRSNAGDANAVPVAEYALAAILLANKQVLRAARLYRERRAFVDRELEFPGSGNYRRVVGVVGASRIGRRLVELLRPHDLSVVVHDPFLDEREAAALGVRRVDLPELMAGSDVVSLHAPLLPGTVGMISRELLALMRPGATLVNTARGALVDQDALVELLVTGRIDAVLDVTEPEVLDRSSPLFDLPNVLLTPHVAGSMGTELRRLGRCVADEVVRLGRGVPLHHLEA